jgi:hypothetical protein
MFQKYQTLNPGNLFSALVFFLKDNPPNVYFGGLAVPNEGSMTLRPRLAAGLPFRLLN